MTYEVQVIFKEVYELQVEADDRDSAEIIAANRIRSGKEYSTYDNIEINVHGPDIDEDIHKCDWCEEEYETSELMCTDLGIICPRCFAAIVSRGESITVLYNY